jgi:hypothetical protein
MNTQKVSEFKGLLKIKIKRAEKQGWMLLGDQVE